MLQAQFAWLGSQPRLVSLATRWGVGHLRWRKISQGNQLIHSRLNVVRPESLGERLALPGVVQMRPYKMLPQGNLGA